MYLRGRGGGTYSRGGGKLCCVCVFQKWRKGDQPSCLRDALPSPPASPHCAQPFPSPASPAPPRLFPSSSPWLCPHILLLPPLAASLLYLAESLVGMMMSANCAPSGIVSFSIVSVHSRHVRLATSNL